MRLIDKDLCISLINYGKIQTVEEIEGIDEVKAIPIEFIDRQIDFYEKLFEKGLYNQDDYDEHYRMMVDSLKTLKSKWRKFNDKH